MSMNVMPRFAAAVLVGAGVAGLMSVGTAEVADAAPAKARWVLKRIGRPKWKPVDFHMFPADLGVGGANFMQFAEQLLAAPNHVPHADLGIGPGAAHQNWTTELGEGVRRLGIQEKARFTADEFSGSKFVFFTYMVVPARGAPTGPTPDGATTAMIPKSAFPLAFRGETLKGPHQETFDPIWSFDVKALDAITPPFANGNHSHFPMFGAENLTFGPQGAVAAGQYFFRSVLLDQQGNGWEISTRFRVQ